MMAFAFMKLLAEKIKEKGGDFELKAHDGMGDLRPVTGLGVSMVSRGSLFLEEVYVDTREFGQAG